MLILLLLERADLRGADAVAHYKSLLAAGGYGRLPRERAAFVVREADGGLSLVHWTSSDFEHATYRGALPRGTIAIAHTHPRHARRPSPRDRAEARRLGIPIIVIAPDAVTMARSDGRDEELLGGRWSLPR